MPFKQRLSFLSYVLLKNTVLEQREKRPNPYEYPRYTNAKTTTTEYKKNRGDNEVVFLKEAEWYNP